MFSNARNVVFTGNPMFTSRAIDLTAGRNNESLDKGIKLLLQRVAKGAMHNSGERFDAPTCHPETRIALQDDILGWADEPPSGQLVTWMYGPAGAGKSAIAQTISQKLHVKGQLAASFFFSRTSASRGRGDETALIATLAHQLSLSAPATKSLIEKAVWENPLIFDLSLDDQAQALIVYPLTVCYQDHADLQGPAVIVVDGLDECRKNDNAQSRVVSALIKGISSIPHRRHKLFITSRPEYNIVAIFRGYKPEVVRKMELNNKWNPDDDVRAFLNASFADIRRSHFYFETHPADHTWPSRAKIDALVARSSGQFIYASVVIKYIQSEDYYDPVARLEIILKLKNNEDKPYAELDALYEHIFSQTRNLENVLTVLSLDRVCAEGDTRVPLSLVLSDLTGMCIDEIKSCLRPLVSVLVWEKDAIRYMHASLPDFLLDQTRSDIFFINSTPIASKIVRQAVNLLEDEGTHRKDYLMPILLSIPVYYAKRSPDQHKMDIYAIISYFDIVQNVLCRMDVSTYAGSVFKFQITRAVSSYLEWILNASESESPSECRKALAEPLCKIQTWLMRHLAYESFNGSDNPEQIDLWPFLTVTLIHRSCCADDLQRQVSNHIALALEICGPTTFSYQLSRDQDFELSNSSIIFYCLLPLIPQWLARTDLLGRYAITRERYAVALLRTWRFLLRLPSNQLAEVLRDSSPDKGTLSVIRVWVKEAVIKFIELAPTSVELYFFILFLYPVVVYYRQDQVPEGHFHLMHRLMTSTKRYLEMTRKEFPFLYDSTSPGYIRAQAHAEESWIEIKRDFYDPISSVLGEALLDVEQEQEHWMATHVCRSE